MKKIGVLLTFIVFLFSNSLVINSAEASSGAKVDKFVTESKKHVKTPYKYGGTTPKGFDCSGFVGYSYKKSVGSALPRTASDMYKKGKTVSKSQLKKGDLVFFSTNRKGVSHVGIYVGNNQFIHASSSKGVTVDKMSNSYWKTKYVGAKRTI
ncbi:NlpC/P60 family protein [Bacillus lacus]|uniref:NlpC/P60 family protein n=1 Tax=Metabacillus lacus TaxID=1983721 RepID=A0A7X2IZ20_9BACI|nr:C40 family peptidase [Metabacillus lacus]MRX72269.1 NlpC/P60 family protein [Metabacillus lacus]